MGILAITGDGRIPWSNSASIMDPYLKRDILEFYILLIQGPLTQFFLRSQLPSLIESAEMLTTMQTTASIRSYLLEKFEAADSTHVMKRSRFLMSSLLGILQLDDTLNGSSPVLTEKIGAVLKLAAVVVERFYSTYERFEKEIATSIKYCKEWRKTSRRRFRSYLLHNKDVAKDNCGHDDMLSSGTFFPNHPQVRPFPFNDKSKYKDAVEEYGGCVKEYLSTRPDITPGAITFCCPCAHPIIFGFKVLERGEGPRAVLDVLVSRFPQLPEFVIYDFACGLLKSEQHTLRWAIQDVTLISDRFHVDNHTCHRGFHPDCHNLLNGYNTVSHEQRNRAIAMLKDSMRNSGQLLYTSLLAYQTMYLNLRAIIKTEIDTQAARNPASISGKRRGRVSRRRGNSTVVPREEILSSEEIQKWYFKKLEFTPLCCSVSY